MHPRGCAQLMNRFRREVRRAGGGNRPRRPIRGNRVARRATRLPRVANSDRIRAMNTSLSSTVKTADWKAEKHVPVIAAPAVAKAGEPFDVEIDVGKEIPHPNTAQHHIVWIALHFVPDGSTTSIELGRADFSAHGASMSETPGPAATAPSTRFRVALAVPGVLHATAYCNLHGLWTSAEQIAVDG